MGSGKFLEKKRKKKIIVGNKFKIRLHRKRHYRDRRLIHYQLRRRFSSGNLQERGVTCSGSSVSACSFEDTSPLLHSMPGTTRNTVHSKGPRTLNRCDLQLESKPVAHKTHRQKKIYHSCSREMHSKVSQALEVLGLRTVPESPMRNLLCQPRD